MVRTRLYILSLAFFLTASGLGFAQTVAVTFRPGPGLNDGSDEGGPVGGKDTFDLRNESPVTANSNNGASGLQHHFNSSCNVWLGRSYYQFDVSSLPAADLVTGAELVLYQRVGAGFGYELASTTMVVEPVIVPWNEMTLTFNNRPAVDAVASSVTYATVVGGNPAFEGFVTIDITELYKSWRNGTRPNYGFAYSRPQTICENTNYNFTASSDNADESKRPALVITYLTEPPASPPEDSCEPLTDGLLGCWDAAGDAQDRSGNGQHGTLVNGAGFGTGVNGGTAFSLDGVDDYVGINNALGNGAAAITVEAWINPGALPLPGTVGTWDYIVASDDAGSFSEPSLFSLSINRHGPVSYLPSSMTGFSVSFGIRAVGQPEVHAAFAHPDVSYYSSYWWGSAIATNPTEVAVGQWAHLVGVYDGIETRLYINGRLAATSALQPDGANRSVTGPLVTTPVPRRIGRPSYDADPTYGSFTGLIDNVKIYGRALEECEIPQSAEGPCEPEDTTAPEIAMPNEVTAEATSASGTAVSYIVSALDDVDGEVTPECSPASGETFALGVTTVTCTAADEAGNASEETFDVTVEDTTPPAVTVPADITAEATGASGASVSYAVEAAPDTVDGTVAPSCLPASGSVFPLGDTEVTCTATDAAGNSSEASFTVTVTVTRGTIEELLRRWITNRGILNSLLVKLQHRSYGAFENQVNAISGRWLTSAQAAEILVLLPYL